MSVGFVYTNNEQNEKEVSKTYHSQQPQENKTSWNKLDEGSERPQ
jgi:hypothetical protein